MGRPAADGNVVHPAYAPYVCEAARETSVASNPNLYAEHLAVANMQSPSGKANSTDDLARGMVRVLAAQRELGGEAYPPTLQRLGRLTDPAAPFSAVAKAAKTRHGFENNAIVARKQEHDAPVALVDDASLLAEAPQTLRYAIGLCSKNKSKAHTVAELRKKLTGRSDNVVQKHFQRETERRISEDDLPEGIGYVVVNARPRLFHLDDLHPAAWRSSLQCGAVAARAKEQSTAPSLASLAQFPHLFAGAFQQLDRKAGGYNFVPLAELRAELPQFSRDEFDASLRELRVARQFELSSAENRSDVSPEQRAAGIQEAGSLLLYAKRV